MRRLPAFFVFAFALSALWPDAPALAASTKGVFTIDCFYSHSLVEDPIVFPGQSPAGHLHDFFGNRSTNANSTYASMAAAPTKCKLLDDTAGYWNPAGYLNGTRLPGRKIAVYYTGLAEGSVENIPSGLQTIGGDSHATSSADNPHTFWFCGTEDSPKTSHPYNCSGYGTDGVTGVVNFPRCWDGTGTGRDDVRYADGTGTCPSGFGLKLPMISYRVHFGIKDPCAGATPCGATDSDANVKLTLSSGPYYTLHADFWNTWNQGTLDNLVASCLNGHVNCGKEESTPTLPTGPTISATAGDGAVSLSWSAPASDGGSAVTGYAIYRGTSAGDESSLTSVGNVTSYQDSGLTNGTMYFYRVAAVNAVGEGALGNEASVTPQGATVPGAPTLSAASGKGKGIALSWTAPADGGSAITGYRIYRGTSSGGESLLASVGAVTSYKDTATSRGTIYYYEVSAVNAVGEGSLSNEASATAK